MRRPSDTVQTLVTSSRQCKVVEQSLRASYTNQWECSHTLGIEKSRSTSSTQFAVFWESFHARPQGHRRVCTRSSRRLEDHGHRATRNRSGSRSSSRAGTRSCGRRQRGGPHHGQPRSLEVLGCGVRRALGAAARREAPGVRRGIDTSTRDLGSQSIRGGALRRPSDTTELQRSVTAASCRPEEST